MTKIKQILLATFVLFASLAIVAPANAASVVAWNTIKASQIPGVVLDCVVNPNVTNVGKTATGGTCTDNTTALNAAIGSLASTGTGAIKLVLDGGTATTGLVIPSVGYFEIEGIGWNSGVYMIAGSNSHAIYNNGKTGLFDQGPTAPARGGYVHLSNFTINGNRGNGTTGNSTSGDPRGPGPGSYFYDNIDLANLSSVRINNVFSYDSPAYSIRLNNCGDIVVESNYILNPNTTSTFNQDSVHIDGPADDIRVAFNRMDNNGSDDGVALNAVEGYSGTLTRAVVTGNTYLNTLTALRLYGGNTSTIAQVEFSGNRGTVNSSAVIFGAALSTNQDVNVQSFVASDDDFVASGAFANVQGSVGMLSLENCILLSPASASNFLSGTSSAANISDLTITNSSIYRTTAGNNTSTALIAATAAFSITRMTINNFRVVNEAGQSYAAISKLLAMTNVTIGSLYVASLDYTNITALADSFTGISNLSGPGYPNRQQSLTAKTANYTAVPTDIYERFDCTSGALTYTLPAAPYLYEEHEVEKVDSGTNALTIAGNGKTINGNASLSSQWAHAKFRYNGTTWDSL